jgi:DNA-binding transcriptional regulator YbjK
MGEPLDYSFDVFFSYKRHELTAEWTRRVQEHLKLWLSEEMQRAITMFVDVETLEIGSRWPDKLQAAIKVPVAW